MINTQTLKGNLINQDYSTAFTLNQGDKRVPFRVELLENGTPYTLQSTDIVTIEWLKPNGNPFLQEGNIKYGTNYIEFTTPESVAQYSGSGSFNIIISNGDVRKGTIRREYKVVPTSMKPGSVSEDVITDAITELRELSVDIANTVQNNQDLINNNQAATKTDIANVNSSLEEKASKSEIGSPLVANTVAEMTDTSKVYVYTGSETGYTSGNWYYYNGTSWVSGGVYNSQGIGEGTITEEKTTFFEYTRSDNRFNKNTATVEKIINITDGALKDSTTYYTSDYIYCGDKVGKYAVISYYENDTIIGYNWQVFAFYDTNYNFISTYGGSANTPDGTIVPSNAKYLRFSSFQTHLDYKNIQLTFEDSLTLPTEYFKYTPQSVTLRRDLLNLQDSDFKILNNFSLSSANFLNKSGKTPLITWVDDDTIGASIPNVKTICDTLGIKCTFGCITKFLTSETTLNLLKEYQAEGFHITTHSNNHDRWYKDSTDGTKFTIEECEKDLILSLKILQENGFIDYNYFIAPGDCLTREGIDSILKKWCVCTVNPNGNDTNHLYANGRFNINRQFILKGNTASTYTTLIDKAILNGDWLIFGTHSGISSQWDGDLVQTVLQYAIDNGVQIATLNEAYKIRENLYRVYEMFS